MDFFELFVLLDHLLNLNERKKFSCLNFQKFCHFVLPLVMKYNLGNISIFASCIRVQYKNDKNHCQHAKSERINCH